GPARCGRAARVGGAAPGAAGVVNRIPGESVHAIPGSPAMNVVDAIRKRRAVRTYTDTPVPDETVDRLLRLALSAPTGGGAQAWSLAVIRAPEQRREVAELVIDGGGQY